MSLDRQIETRFIRPLQKVDCVTIPRFIYQKII